MHGRFDWKQAEIATVVAEHAWKRPPQTRMRMPVVRQTVGADHCGWKGEHALHVIFAHLEVARAAGLQPYARLLLGTAPLRCDVAQMARRHFRMRLGPGDDNVDDAVDKIGSEHSRTGDV